MQNIARPPVTNVREIRHQIIWGNESIKLNGKTLWFNTWIKSNVIFVNDLFDSKGNFNTHTIFEHITDKRNIMSELYTIYRAIPVTWKSLLQKDPCKIMIKKPSILDVKFIVAGRQVMSLNSVGSSREFYGILVNIKKITPCTQKLWRSIFSEKNISWNNVYKEKLCNVKEQKIIAFNYKVLNNILATP